MLLPLLKRSGNALADLETLAALDVEITVKDKLFLVTQHIFIIVFSNKKADQTISEVTFLNMHCLYQHTYIELVEFKQ